MNYSQQFRVLLVATISISIATLAACSDGSSPTSPTPAYELTESSLISGAYANPLDAIEYPEQKQQDIITAAIEDDMAECMTSHGFTYFRGDGYGRWTKAENAQYTFTVTDPKVAAVYGFHMESWIKRAQQLADGSVSNDRPDGYIEALWGDADTEIKDADGAVLVTYDPTSCQGAAMDANMPEWAMQHRLIELSGAIVFEASKAADDSVVKELAAWQECMAGEGFDYPSPGDATNTFTGDFPTEEEIVTAVASAQCQHSSGLLRAVSKARAEYAIRELEKHPGIIAEFTRIQNNAYENARKGSQ